ncbi:MAG: hemolysin III family protein [Bdellovibrionales bacterium]|nr:hemolysin III family protein [Bdellovibrionales bacterium]
MEEIKPAWGLRHPVSAATHLLGAGGALAATAWGLPRAMERDHWAVAGLLGFGLSMVFLFLASGFYHGLNLRPRAMVRLRLLDHSLIYVFIAGSYTPFCLVLLRESVGVPVALAVWAVALFFVGVKLWVLESSRWVRVAPYLAMGAAGFALVPSLAEALPFEAMFWLFVGGGWYGLGALVYALKRPDPWPKAFGFHEIWHVCVLAATACHFFVVLRWVV